MNRAQRRRRAAIVRQFANQRRAAGRWPFLPLEIVREAQTMVDLCNRFPSDALTKRREERAADLAEAFDEWAALERSRPVDAWRRKLKRNANQ